MSHKTRVLEFGLVPAMVVAITVRVLKKLDTKMPCSSTCSYVAKTLATDNDKACQNHKSRFVQVLAI